MISSKSRSFERIDPALVGLGRAVALETDQRIKSFINKAKQRHRHRVRR